MSSENNVTEYNEKQKTVLQWIESGCDYLQGTMLYGQFGKNIFLRTDFHSKQRKYATKIIYELCKSVGLDYAQLQKKNRIQIVKKSLIKETWLICSAIITSSIPAGICFIIGIGTEIIVSPM